MMSGRHKQSGKLRLAFSLGLAASALYLAGCGGGTQGLSQTGSTPRAGTDRDIATGNRKADGTVGRMGLYLSVTPGPFRAAPAKSTTKAAAVANSPGDTGKSSSIATIPSPAPSPVAIAAVVAAAAPTAPAPEHLWVTVLKVELIDQEEKAVSVFDDAQGQSVDLMALGGTPGSARRFLPLACAAPPAGKSYTRVRVTFDKAFLAFAPGKSVAETKPIADDLPRDNEGRPVLSFPLDKGRELGNGKENLVVDVDLSRTDTSAERIAPVLHEGSRDGLTDLSRQEAVAFSGTVSEVTTKAGETVFALALPASRTLMVQATDATVFYADGQGKNPALKDGATVQVRGTLAPATKRLVAQDVRVYAADQKPASDAATVRGKIVAYDAKAGTATVAVQQAENFQPTQAKVTVALPKDAVLRSSGGLAITPAQFGEQAQAGTAANTPPVYVTAEGTYEAATGTLTATNALLDSAKPAQSHEAEVFGLAKDLNATGGKLTVEAPSEWQGFIPVTGASIAVTTAPTATYLTEDGKAVTRSEFFAAAAQKTSGVRVVGTYNDGKVTATRLSLAPPPAAPEPKIAKNTKADADAVKADKAEKTPTDTKADKMDEPAKSAAPVEGGEKTKPDAKDAAPAVVAG